MEFMYSLVDVGVGTPWSCKPATGSAGPLLQHSKETAPSVGLLGKLRHLEAPKQPNICPSE